MIDTSFWWLACYQEWLVKRKVELRSKRKKLGYKGINKQAGDITLAYINEHKRGVGWLKSARPIGTLTENRYLTVLIDDGDTKTKEMAKSFHDILKCTLRVRFATVGRLERKKIPDHFQFINFEKFMTRDCKPFMRLASALRFAQVIREFETISNSRNGIFQNCLNPLVKDKEVLDKYVSEHYRNMADNEIEKCVLDAADVNDLYDKQYWDVYLRLKEGVKKYEFITCFHEPRVWDMEATKKYNRAINQMLLFRRLYYKDLPEEVTLDKDI